MTESVHHISQFHGLFLLRESRRWRKGCSIKKYGSRVSVFVALAYQYIYIYIRICRYTYACACVCTVDERNPAQV